MVDDAPTDPRYPEIEPYAEGFLDTTDGQRVHWETSGSPTASRRSSSTAAPAAGSGRGRAACSTRPRTASSSSIQRGCGLSTPSAGAPDADLSTNARTRLLDDIERLREHLGIERWLVQGASWGSTSRWPTPRRHPARVSELIVWGVTTGRWSEFDWVSAAAYRCCSGRVGGARPGIA
jgi:proline iminopeptidase